MRYIKHQLKIFLPLLLVLGMLGTQSLVPAGAFAASPTCGSATGSSKQQVLHSIGSQTASNDCTGKGVDSVVRAAVAVLSYVVGAAAVIMIVVSGLRYITSSGDSAKVTAAKTTLIYALIGVAIAALAQLLVHFALNQSTNALNAFNQTAPIGIIKNS
jgi:ABC-type Fe3+ transport system permease subunit